MGMDFYENSTVNYECYSPKKRGLLASCLGKSIISIDVP